MPEATDGAVLPLSLFQCCALTIQTGLPQKTKYVFVAMVIREWHFFYSYSMGDQVSKSKLEDFKAGLI